MQPVQVERRRDFHVHPERAFTEVRTAGCGASRLGELGYEVTPGVGKTCVVSPMAGSAQTGENIHVRLEMDALPILEAVHILYSSKTDGIRHAFGHCAHTSIGMGVAETMARHEDRWNSVVKFEFQPAEETFAGANVDPRMSAVVTVGSVDGGSAGHSVHDEVKTHGTPRTFELEIRKLAMRRIPEIAKGIAKGMGCSAVVNRCTSHVPATVITPRFAELVRESAPGLPDIHEIDISKTTTGSQHNIRFLEAAPGTNEPHHSPPLEISEASMPLAVALPGKAAMDMLSVSEGG